MQFSNQNRKYFARILYETACIFDINQQPIRSPGQSATLVQSRLMMGTSFGDAQTEISSYSTGHTSYRRGHKVDIRKDPKRSEDGIEEADSEEQSEDNVEREIEMKVLESSGNSPPSDNNHKRSTPALNTHDVLLSKI